jgi:RimJ/RimL family protein N-acetyltransferase
MADLRIETERLALRSWLADDVDDFLVVNSDPAVMATLGPLMDRDQVAATIFRMQEIEAEHGHCFWAMVRAQDHRVIGWCGAIRGTVDPIKGQLEIGWRMARDCWGHGYATEAAAATLDWLFANREDDAAWAITTPANRGSRAVMERLGMDYLPELDFDHPGVPADDPLLRHVTYRITRTEWLGR